MRTGFWSYPSILIQIIVAILTFAYGLGIFIYYITRYEINIAIWSFFVSIFSLSVIHLHTLFLRNDLDAWFDPTSFDSIKKLSILFLFVGIFGVSWNVAVAYTQEEVFTWYGHYVAAIISGVLMFWCFVIIISTRKYKRYVELCIPIVNRRF